MQLSTPNHPVTYVSTSDWDCDDDDCDEDDESRSVSAHEGCDMTTGRPTPEAATVLGSNGC